MARASEAERGSSRRVLVVRALALLPLAAGGAIYFFHPPLRAALDEGVSLLAAGDLRGLRAWGERLGPWAAASTSLLMVVQALAAPIPAVLVTATNSLLFGPFLGGILSIVSATVAASICYLIARLLGDAVAARLVSQAARERAEAFISRHGAAAVLIARLVPIVPFDPISYAAGLVRMRHSTFFWATLVGQIPAGMTYSYLAQEIGRPARLVPLAVGAFLGLLVFGWACRRAILGRSLGRGEERAAGGVLRTSSEPHEPRPDKSE